MLISLLLLLGSPNRACNHVIPLIPGANLVSIRPYRYSPKMNDELETEMLEQGIIQPSASFFLLQSCWFLRKMVDIECVLIIDS
jgi:hypothetical protein